MGQALAREAVADVVVEILALGWGVEQLLVAERGDLEIAVAFPAMKRNIQGGALGMVEYSCQSGGRERGEWHEPFLRIIVAEVV